VKKEDSEESEYNSEYYDEEGKYIWGEENQDWEFYDQEDKDAYEQGLSSVPETLNPQALPVELNPMVDEKTGVNLKQKIKA
jgi:hypothetical protein